MFGEPKEYEFKSSEDVDDSKDTIDNLWLAVFDGHGGHRVSEHCALQMQNMYLERYSDLSKEDRTDTKLLKKIFEEIFLDFDEEIKMLPPTTETIYTPNCFGKGTPVTLTKRANAQGATATVVTLSKLFEDDGIVTIGNSGDSRLVAFAVNNIPVHVPDEFEPDDRKSSMFQITSRFSQFMGGEPSSSSAFGSYFNNTQIAMGDGLSKNDSMKVRKILRSKYKRDVIQKSNVQIRRVLETVDHQPTNPNEAKRVIDLGGQVINKRVNGVLAVSRALGDHDQKARKGLSADPDVASYKLSDLFNIEFKKGKEEEENELEGQGKEFIIVMASDGLWTYANTDSVEGDVVEMLSRGYSLKEATQILMDKIIIDHRGIDNTTISIIRIVPTELYAQRDEAGHKEFEERFKNSMKGKGKGTMRSFGSMQANSVMEMEIPVEKEKEKGKDEV